MKMDKAVFLNNISEQMKFGTAKLCFILGAGASKDCGIPTAKELTTMWFTELLGETNIADEWKRILCAEEDVRATAINMLCTDSNLLDKVLRCSKWNINRQLNLEDFIRIKFVKGVTESYSELFAYRYPDAELRNRVIEEFIGKAKVKAGHRALANVLADKMNNVAITTNFDRLIEQAINENNTAINIRKMNHAGDDTCDAFRGNSFSNAFLNSNPPLIIKAHSEITRRGLINTPEEIRYLPDSFFMKLQTIFYNYIPVFIGYNGTDIALVDMLLRYARSSANEKRGCFWLIYGKDTNHPEDLVNDRIKDYVKLVNGKFVMHNGFEKIMPEIAEKVLQSANGIQNHASITQNAVDNPPIPRDDNKVSGNTSVEDLEIKFFGMSRKGNINER